MKWHVCEAVDIIRCLKILANPLSNVKLCGRQKLRICCQEGIQFRFLYI